MWDNVIQKGTIMQQRTTRVNASEETIKIGPLGIRFLLTGDDSSGSVSVFEVLVPVGQKLAAPAHKNGARDPRLSPWRARAGSCCSSRSQWPIRIGWCI